MHRSKLVALAATALFATAVLAPALTGAAAAQTTQVDSCVTIDESGVYELDANFSVGQSTAAGGGPGANDTAGANGTAMTAADGTAFDGTPSPAADETPVPGNASTAQTPGDDASAANRSVAGAGACILITASDVVLEGNGAVLDGRNATGANETANATTSPAADEAAGDDATATPATTESALPDGNATPAANATAHNSSSLVGIAVRPGPGERNVSNVTVRNVTVRNWYAGVSLRNVSGANLDDVRLRNNTVSGVRFGPLPNATVEPSP